jgi:hypothetical protein
MPLRGAAIGPDTVLVWTGERELTRFHRDGSRARIELPFAPLAAQIAEHVIAVDERGTTHRFALDGTPLGFLPLLESPGTIDHAALSADGSKLAIFAGGEVQLFEHGVMRPRSFEHRRIGWHDLGVDLSGDGTCVLVLFESRFATGENLGDDVQGFSIEGSDGAVQFRHIARQLPPLEIAMSRDARRIAICEHGQHVRVAEAVSMAQLHRIEPRGHVQAMQFDGERLGVLFDYELVLVGDEIVRITLPERFEDFVLVGDEAVCIHPELGAWWIKLAAAT